MNELSLSQTEAGENGRRIRANNEEQGEDGEKSTAKEQKNFFLRVPLELYQKSTLLPQTEEQIIGICVTYILFLLLVSLNN